MIALSHWGVAGDRELAAAVDGIDLILGGHSHTTLEEQVWIGDTLVMQTGSHAVALGRADLWMTPAADGEGFTIASVNGREGKWWGHDGVAAPSTASAAAFPTRVLHRPDASTPEHAGVLAAYEPFRSKTQVYLEEVLATASEPITGEGAGQRETPLGNLLADAIRAQGEADVAVMSSSQFKPVTLGPGAVTMADLYGVSGSYTRQHIVTVSSPGTHVRAMLQGILRAADKKPLHVSGVSVTPDGVTLEDGRPLVDEQVYRVSGAAHVMQDHLIGKAGVEVLFDDPQGPTCRDALAAYLRELGTVSAPAAERTQINAAVVATEAGG